jgi:hypothetical protein
MPATREAVAPSSASSPASAAPAVPVAEDDAEAGEWPDEAVESAMRAEQREREEQQPTQIPAGSADPAVLDVAPVEPLPSLEAVIEQIPAEVRATLEELFRARFTSVQRVSPSVLK